MTNEEMIKILDKLSYAELLEKINNSPLNDPFFQGNVGIHFRELLEKKESEIDPIKREIIKCMTLSK